MSKLNSTFASLIAAIFLLSGCTAESTAYADEADTTSDIRMTSDRLGELIQNVDEEAVANQNSWQFKIEGLQTTVVYDENADRMRIVIPIVPAEDLEPEILLRVLQANFDSALDARYAVAQGMLWGTYIHPLSTLTDEEFLVGLGQTANVVVTFGTSFSSGVFIFGGGDSSAIERRELIDELKKKKLDT